MTQRIAGLFLLFVWMAAAAPLRAETVAEVLDGDTLRLADGRIIRLAGLRAPKPAAWEDPAPVAEVARDALATLVRGHAVTLAPEGPRDRHGRLRRHVWREDGLWLQGEMLHRGLAMVETRAADSDHAAQMLRHESAARDAGRGLWADPRFAVQSADSVRSGGFRIVEGRVRAVKAYRDTAYLNFGEDWRRDFTLSIATESLAALGALGLDPGALVDRTVRVRGWVDWRNGPMMTLDHAEQVEVLSADMN